MTLARSRRTAAALIATAALSLSACSSDEEDTTSAPTTSSDSTTVPTVTDTEGEEVSDQVLTLVDGVVRATVEDNPMTSIFGALVNNTDKDVTVVGFTASVDAEHFEIHTVEDGVMMELPDGITIPAGGTYEMVPGGDHLMIMGLAEEIAAGDVVDLVLELGDGQTVEVDGVPVRTIAAGDENYGEDGEVVGESGIDHQH